MTGSKFILIPALLALFCVSLTVEAKEGKSFEQPKTKPGQKGWEIYETQAVYTKANVADLRPGQSSPEAALVHFYASLIRKDEHYKEVLPDPANQKGRCKRVLKLKMDKLTSWTFTKIKLLKRKKLSDSKYWIKIEMEVQIRGKTDGGKDEAALELIDGKWFVTEPPS